MPFDRTVKRQGVTIREDTKMILGIFRGYHYISHSDVLVGVPQEANAAHEGGVTMAELMYIHSEGSPARGIPARPTIQKAIANKKVFAQAQDYLNKAIGAALMGRIGEAQKYQHMAGICVENATKAVFGSSELAPLSPYTIAHRKKHSAAPLVDTGALRNSITHVVRKK